MGNFRATSIFFREHFPLLEFFLGQCGNIFWGYSACMNFLAQIYFYDASPTPPPPITFLMVRRDGNYVTVAQFVFLFLLRAFCGELFNEWTSKTLNVIVQDESTINFHGPYSYRSQK